MNNTKFGKRAAIGLSLAVLFGLLLALLPSAEELGTGPMLEMGLTVGLPLCFGISTLYGILSLVFFVTFWLPKSLETSQQRRNEQQAELSESSTS